MIGRTIYGFPVWKYCNFLALEPTLSPDEANDGHEMSSDGDSPSAEYGGKDSIIEDESPHEHSSPMSPDSADEFSIVPVAEEVEEPTRAPARPLVNESSSVAWDRDWSPQRLANELKHIEDEVREMLEGRDPRRKRKFTGTRRWLELQEDLITMQFGDKFDQQSLARIQQLIRRRHSLYNQLRYLAGTRPTWNT